ncbi:MAG: Carbonic anhydrase [Gammaproteobacteria bacterium]|nr:Carbonic anhydrase [Gammaproteobacteria bacterium]
MITDSDIESYWEEADTPERALARLYAGNRRFAAGHILAPRRNIEQLQRVASGQRPFAAFLGCADSRVPVEIVFDQGFGDIFVARVAGNIASAEVVGSLEFASEVLDVKVIYVLGHTACGAVSATVKGEEVPGLISSLFYHIKPAVRAAGGDPQRSIVENARIQAQLLAETSPVLAKRVRAGLLVVAAGVYDLASGLVAPVDLD